MHIRVEALVALLFAAAITVAWRESAIHAAGFWQQVEYGAAPSLVAEVRPQVSGIVKEQGFREGGWVDAGQTLYRIDAAAFRAEYDSARAAVNHAEAALDIARLNADRAGKLVGTDVISRQEHENTMAILRQAEADVAVAEANLASARVDLDYTEITAPIDGRVGKSSVTVGALVTANQQAPLVTVQQLEPVYVDLTQSAEELLELRRQLETRNLMDDTGVLDR